jgi:hypothetical protein
MVKDKSRSLCIYDSLCYFLCYVYNTIHVYSNKSLGIHVTHFLEHRLPTRNLKKKGNNYT